MTGCDNVTVVYDTLIECRMPTVSGLLSLTLQIDGLSTRFKVSCDGMISGFLVMQLMQFFADSLVETKWLSLSMHHIPD